MRPNVFAYTMNDNRRVLLRWSLVLAGAAALTVLTYPLLVLLSGGRALAEPLPEGLALLLAAPAVPGLAGWVTAVGLNLLLPALLVFFAVRRGSALIAGEEERGSLGLLLAAPIQRYRLVIEKFAVLCLLILGPTLAAGAVLAVAALLAGEPELAALLPSAVPGLFLLGLVFGTLAMAAGSLTGRRLLSQNLILGIALLALAASRVPPGTAWYITRLFSPFYYYHQALLAPLFSPPVWALAGLAAAFFALAWLVFEHRDLAV